MQSADHVACLTKARRQAERFSLCKPDAPNCEVELSIDLQPPANPANTQIEWKKACSPLAMAGGRGYKCKTL